MCKLQWHNISKQMYFVCGNKRAWQFVENTLENSYHIDITWRAQQLTTIINQRGLIREYISYIYIFVWHSFCHSLLNCDCSPLPSHTIIFEWIAHQGITQRSLARSFAGAHTHNWMREIIRLITDGQWIGYDLIWLKWQT